MNWDFALGLTKDVSLEPFYKGQEVQKLKLNEDLAKKAKEAERTQKMMEKFNVSNANIHPSIYGTYEQEIGDLAKEALTKSSRGELTPQEQFRIDQEVANRKTKYEGISKNLSRYQDQTPDKLDESGRYLQGELRAGKTLDEIRKNSPYENISYMKLFDDNGEIKYDNTYVTSNDPLGELVKSIPQEHILESKVVDGRRVEAKGLAKTNEELKSRGYDPRTNVSLESVLTNEVSNKNFVNDVRRKYYKDYDAEADKAAEYYAADALKPYKDNLDYNSLLKSKIEEVKKDPMYSDLIEKKAAFEVGMKHAPRPIKYSERDIPKPNVTNVYNGGSGLTKPEGKQKYSGMLLEFGQQKDKTISKIQNATTPQEAANAFFGATGINPSVDITKNKGKNIKLYEPIPLSKEVKSKPYNMVIDANTLVERVVNGRKVQSKLSEVLDATELENLLNRNNVISLYPKDQSMYAYDYNNNSFITADDVMNDKNVLANAAPYLRRYSDIDVKDLSKNLETDKGGGIKILDVNEANIVKKLRGVKFIQDKTQVEEASDWDKDENDYIKSYQEKKNAPLQTQYKGTTGGNKTTTSTPSKPEVKTSKGGVTFKVIK